MKIAAIYCRVSTDNQEKEGTSLTTQSDACLKYCRERGYETPYRFVETYSGLTLDRPKLNELREIIRARKVENVIVFCLDRLSRDPTHLVIITEEMEEHRVKLEAVTESVDNSELGKLISYIRGFASKLEAEKIRERSMRGKLARARAGRIPSGSGGRIYGYDYIPVAQENGGRRVINETETKWVREMFSWLINEGLSTNGIVYRLRAYNAPSKSGKPWNRRTVQAILRNPGYIGKTYVFTTIKGKKPYSKPREEWVNIPNVTPAIISVDLFETAQRQLRINAERSPRNCKRQYLLRSHLKCRRCGRTFAGMQCESILRNGVRKSRRNYCCIGKIRLHNPFELCSNKRWSADKLENIVWSELEQYISAPEIIEKVLEQQRYDAESLDIWKTQIDNVERQLLNIEREQERLLKWALQGFPENQVEAENNRLKKARESLLAQRDDLETRIKAGQGAVVNMPKLKTVVKNIQERIKVLDYEDKRRALDMLGITVWLDGEDIEITGTIPVSDEVIAGTLSEWHEHNKHLVLPFSIKVDTKIG